ncbi:MAG: YbjN domain-containing protein [Pseudomonadota bacterium]
MIRTILVILAATNLTLSMLAETSTLVDASDAERIAGLMQDEGYRAKVEVDSDGDLSIVSGVGGVEFNVYFRACDDELLNCELLVFNSGFDLKNGSSEAKMTQWNQTQWTKAYLDREKDPFLELPVNMLYGISEENFRDTLNWFAGQVTKFADHIGWNDEPSVDPIKTFADPI